MKFSAIARAISNLGRTAQSRIIEALRGEHPTLHHVWVGSRIKQKELDYARVWAQANPKSKQRIWVDPSALMVNDVKRVIIQWAEHRALTELGITNRAELESLTLTGTNLSQKGREFFELVTKFASEKRYALNDRLKALEGAEQQTHDTKEPSGDAENPNHPVNAEDIRGKDRIRINFAVELYAEMNGSAASESYRGMLEQRMAQDAAFTTQKIAAGELHDIAELKTGKFSTLFAAYEQELNLRQNGAAASDIARVLALYAQGGVYTDLDLLPKSGALEQITSRLKEAGFDISSDKDRLPAAITDALISALGCIEGYQPGERYEIDAKDYFRNKERLAGPYTEAEQAELAEVNARRKATIGWEVDKFIADRDPSRPRPIFDALPRLKKGDKAGDGFSMAITPGKGAHNAFIVSSKSHEGLKKVIQQIVLHYKMLDELAGDIEKFAIGSDADKQAAYQAISDKVMAMGDALATEATRNTFMGALADYMADGIAPGGMASVAISGAGAFMKILLDECDGSDEAVEKKIATDVYNRHGADERTSSWSNGDGTTQIDAIAKHHFVDKTLHHVWLGSSLATKERDYAKIWADANPDYADQIWIDPNALAVNTTKKALVRYAEWCAAKDLNINNLDAFNAQIDQNKKFQEFTSATIKHATQKRLELNALLANTAPEERDNVRIDFIAVLLEEMDGPVTAKEVRATLLRGLAADRRAMIGDTSLRNVQEVLDLPKNAALKQAYDLELNLRQNMAGASDIARVALLEHLGGAYVDFDILPSFNLSFEEIKKKLTDNGYLLPDPARVDSESRLRSAITAAMIEQLGAITGYDTKSLNPPPIGDVSHLDADTQANARTVQAEILRRSARQIIDEAGPDRSVFAPLGHLDPQHGGFMTGDGIHQIGNYFMVSKAEGEIISRLRAEILKRYAFLLDPEVFKELESFALSSDPSRFELDTKLNIIFGKRHNTGEVARTPSYIGKVPDYLADGIDITARATASISGPLTLIDVLNAYLGPGNHSREELTRFEAWYTNRHTSDSDNSSWLIDGLDPAIEKIRKDLFEPGRFTENVNRDAEPSTRWVEPTLVPAVEGAAHDETFNYDHQIIVQLDNDEVSRAAAVALFNKRADKSDFAQWREDGIETFKLDAAGAVVHAPGNFESGSHHQAIRITFVGHGDTSNGVPTFGGREASTFLEQLAGVLAQLGRNPQQRVMINLVGCRLEDMGMQPHETFAGQVAAGLASVVTANGLSVENIAMRAREGDVSVASSGNKSTSGVQYDFDSAKQGFVRSDVLPAPKPEDRVKGAEGILGGHDAHHRSDREALLLQLCEVIKLRDMRNEGLSSLVSPDEHARLIPEWVREAEGGGYEVGYAMPDALGHIVPDANTAHWVHTDNDVFMRWQKRAQALGNALRAGVTRAADGAKELGGYLLTSDTEGNPVHTISSAFLLRALIGPEGSILAGNKKNALEALSGRNLEDLSAEEIDALESRLSYLRMQEGVNYAALTGGVVNDGVELAKLFNVLKDADRSASGLTKGLAKAASALGALGLAFDIGSVVFAGIDVAQAETERDRAEALVNLGFSLASTGIEIGALAAGVVATTTSTAAVGTGSAGALGTVGAVGAGGAATAAAILASLGVVVTGLSIGAAALAHTIHEERDKIDQGLWILEQYLEAADQPLQTLPNADPTDADHVTSAHILKFHDSLAATEFDMNTGRLVFADVRVAALKDEITFVVPGTSDNYLDMLAPFHDESGVKMLDIAGMEDGSVLVLPHRTAVDFDYQLRTDGVGEEDLESKFPQLYKLERATPDHKFYLWGTGGFGSTYVPGFLASKYRASTFKLVLNNKRNTIVVPTVDRSKDDGFSHIPAQLAALSYTLVGTGGNYTLVLPAITTPVTIQSDFAATERWTFDLSSAVFGLQDDSSATPRELPKGLLSTLAMSAQGLSIGGTTVVSIEGGVKREQITVIVSLDTSNTTQLVWTMGQGDWLTTPDAQNGLALRTGKSDSLSRDTFNALAVKMRNAGVTQRYVSLVTSDGCIGEVDLDEGGWTLSRSNVGDHAITLLIDGVVVGSAAVDGAFQWGHFQQDQAAGIVASHVIDNDHQLNIYFLNGKRVREELVVSDKMFKEYAGYDSMPIYAPPFFRVNALSTQTSRAHSAVRTWLEAHDQYTVHMRSEGAGEATISVSDQEYEITEYRYTRSSFDLTIDLRNERAMVKLHHTGGFSGTDLNEFSGLLARVQELEIMALDSEFSDKRLKMALNLDIRALREKHITLMTSGTVDLSVAGKDLTWDVDGPDLAFFTPGHNTLRWLAADQSISNTHTLSLGDTPSGLETTLAHHAALREPHVWDGDFASPSFAPPTRPADYDYRYTGSASALLDGRTPQGVAMRATIKYYARGKLIRFNHADGSEDVTAEINVDQFQRRSLSVKSYRVSRSDLCAQYSSETGELVVHRIAGFRTNIATHPELQLFIQQAKTIRFELEPSPASPGVIALNTRLGNNSSTQVEISCINPVRLELLYPGKDVKYELDGDDLVIATNDMSIRVLRASSEGAPAHRIGVWQDDDVSIALIVASLKPAQDSVMAHSKPASEHVVLGIAEQSEHDDAKTSSASNELGAWYEGAQRLVDVMSLHPSRGSGDINVGALPRPQPQPSLSVFG